MAREDVRRRRRPRDGAGTRFAWAVRGPLTLHSYTVAGRVAAGRCGSAHDAQPDRLRHRAQLVQDGVGQLGDDVGDDVAGVRGGVEHLTLDVDAVLGEDAVHARQRTRHVLVEMHDAVLTRALGQVERREVDVERRRTTLDVVAQLRGDEPSDVLLRLLRRAADVRRQHDVGDALQR